MLCANKLSQHAISQSEARKVRHTIPACNSLDKLSQHAVIQLKAREVRHSIPACSGNHSQIGKARQGHHSIHSADTLSQHTLQNLTCIKEAAKAKNSGQAGTSEIDVHLEEPGHKEPQSKQLQDLRRLGKRH